MATADTRQYDVTEYGAVGDGEADDSDALQSALEDAAERGGTVYVPPGEYLTAPLQVGSDTTLHVDSGATVQFVADYEAFPTVESRWEGWNQYGFHPCLWVNEAENVRIEGGGTIDGNGSFWWQYRGSDDWPAGLEARVDEMDDRNDKADDVSSFTLRPPLLQVYESENVSVEGVTLKNSPFWNTHVVYSHDVTVHDVRIQNPADAPNGDGIDVDSSQYVRISDTYINAGDDAICLKSGKNAEGREVGRPCAQITVTNCTVEAGHGGVVIGSEMSGDVRDVAVTNCTFTGTDRGVRIKTQRDRGGVVEDLRFDNIMMRRVVCPFVVNGYYFTDIDADPEPVGEGTPDIRNLTFQHVTARDVASAAFLAGLPERDFTDITFEDVDIEATRTFDADDPDPSMAYNYESTHGVFGKSLGNVEFRDVRIETRSGPAIQFEEVETVDVDGLELVEGQDEPAIVTKNVGSTTLADCSVPASLDTLLESSGEETGDVTVRDGGPGLRDLLDVSAGTLRLD